MDIISDIKNNIFVVIAIILLGIVGYQYFNVSGGNSGNHTFGGAGHCGGDVCMK
jgi:hypothetical protein